jgi:hypothetical protein
LSGELFRQWFLNLLDLLLARPLVVRTFVLGNKIEERECAAHNGDDCASDPGKDRPFFGVRGNCLEPGQHPKSAQTYKIIAQAYEALNENFAQSYHNVSRETFLELF